MTKVRATPKKRKNAEKHLPLVFNLSGTFLSLPNQHHHQVPFVLAQEDVTYTEGEWTFQCEIERNIVYPFNDIKTLTGKSLAQCCEACWDDALCVLWAWVNTTCTLKDNQEGEPVSHEGIFS